MYDLNVNMIMVIYGISIHPYIILKYHTRRLLRPGWFRGVQWTLRLGEDGLLHGGPPCGTYVWVNRGSSKRSALSPDGDLSVPSVGLANLLLV